MFPMDSEVFMRISAVPGYLTPNARSVGSLTPSISVLIKYCSLIFVWENWLLIEQLLFRFKRGHCLKFAVFAIERVGPSSSVSVLFIQCVFGILGQELWPTKLRFSWLASFPAGKCRLISRNYSNANTTFIHFIGCLSYYFLYPGGADKSLSRPTSRCILFDGENISFDVSLVIYMYIVLLFLQLWL